MTGGFRRGLEEEYGSIQFLLLVVNITVMACVSVNACVCLCVRAHECMWYVSLSRSLSVSLSSLSLFFSLLGDSFMRQWASPGLLGLPSPTQECVCEGGLME